MAKNENKKVYELMIAVKPLLPDEVRKEIHKEFLKLVESKGGKILDVDVWGKRYLSYKIAGHNEGYYIIYNYEIAPEHIVEIKRQIQLKQEILRSIIIEVEHPEDIGTGIKKKEIKI
ncbi:TPA: 30S ribosomal protein S6 [Patescibacteria group bacterium]|nr:30S ribosomal protein S6 [Patescibacteria group bacterium]